MLEVCTAAELVGVMRLTALSMVPGATTPFPVLQGESNRGQASPRTTIQRMCQPQEAVQTQRYQPILQRDTPSGPVVGGRDKS